MAAMYDKPVRLLMKDMVKELGLKSGEVLQRDKVFQWFQERYPKIKEGTINAHLEKMSTNVSARIHRNVNSKGDDDLFFRIDPSRYRLYDQSNDPAPIYKEQFTLSPDETAESSFAENTKAEKGASEFAYERDLQSFLSKNLQLLESGLRLYEDDGISGVEFPVGGRFIDILAVDRNNNLVVIELKVSRGYDKVVGQLLRYMAWVEKHQADPGQSVRGIIIAKLISDDLVLATSRVKDIDLFEYELSVSLKKVSL